MIDVNVADAIYCSTLNLICQPIDWWSSAAAWAQAVLTVLTFMGTVVYQARMDRRRLQTQKKESHDREMALARVFAGRELRRWRQGIRSHLNGTFESAADESAQGLDLLESIRWDGSLQELQMLGHIGEVLVELIAGTDEVSDRIAQTARARSPDENEIDIEGERELWRELEGHITKLLTTLNRS